MLMGTIGQPDFSAILKLPSRNGRKVSFTLFLVPSGKIQMEMPDFNEAYKKYGKDIEFLMVNLTDGYNDTVEDVKDIQVNELKHRLKEQAVKIYEMKEAEFPEAEAVRELERVVLLKVIDKKWMDHIDDMDQLRQGIGLRALGQRDPVSEYRIAGFEMFEDMEQGIMEDTVKSLMHVQIQQKIEREQVAKVTGTNKDESAVRAPKKREEKKIYPNDPCPCGSGKKYKQCCMRKV